MKRKDASFVRAAGLISALTLGSRVLGLLREAVCAYFFGAGEMWGDFSIAFRIPNLSRRLFGEGALSAAFIPVLSERLHSDGRASAARLSGGVVVLLAAVLLALVGVGEVALCVARRFSPDLSLSLTAVMLPYMFFICLVAVMAGTQHVVGRFAAPALMPILFNLILIGGVVAGAALADGDQVRHLYILAVVVLVGGLAQVVLQWWALVRVDFKPRICWQPNDPDIRRMLATMAPMVVGLAAVQLNSLADLLVAKIFVARGGGAAVLSYGERLYQLPVGLFGAALATAIFPQLARLASRDERQAFTETLQQGLRLALLVGLPASVGLMMISTPLVRLLYQRGEFDAAATLRVSRVVACYGMGVWAYITQQILVRAYYSLKNARTPMRIASGVVLLNLVLNLILVRWFNESGIAVATAFSAALQVVVLGVLLRRTGLSLHWRALGASGLKIVASTLVMVVGLWTLIGVWPAPESLPAAVTHLAVVASAGAVVFLAAAWLFGCREDILAVLQRPGRE